MLKQSFRDFIFSPNTGGSGKASSYVRALDMLGPILTRHYPHPIIKGTMWRRFYRTHDSIPRNSLIARAMSWTSYVEKSGSGTGEILDKCVEYGLACPEFDPTAGFFKTIIWRARARDIVK